MKRGPLSVSLRQLQYMVAVAEAQSFRGAASRCRVAQPSLSAQIAEVEGSLGVRLFERDRRKVLVTPAGVELIARARSILGEVERLIEAAKRYVDPLASRLRVGVIPTIGPYLLPHVDPALRRAFPALELLWTEDKTADLVSRVEAGDLDAALLAREAELKGLEVEPIGEDPFWLATSIDDALARHSGPVELESPELAGVNVLLLDDGHCLRDQTYELCSRFGAQELGFRATSLSTLVQMVAGGAGVTLLPQLALDVENRRGALALLRFAAPVPHRTIAFAWRKSSPLDAALRRICAVARAAYPRGANAGGQGGDATARRRRPSARAGA